MFAVALFSFFTRFFCFFLKKKEGNFGGGGNHEKDKKNVDKSLTKCILLCYNKRREKGEASRGMGERLFLG